MKRKREEEVGKDKSYNAKKLRNAKMKNGRKESRK